MSTRTVMTVSEHLSRSEIHLKRSLFLLVLTFNLGTLALSQGFDWEWMNPLPGGNALRGVVRLDSANALLLGFFNEIFMTSDQGESWQKQFRDIDERAWIHDVVRMDNGRLFCVASHSYYVTPTLGLSRSDDLGLNWETLESQSAQDGPVLATNGRTVLCQLGRLNAMRLSFDQGEQWTQTIAPGDLVCAAVSESNMIAVGLADGQVLISEDSAKTWFPAHDVADRWIQALTWNDSTLFCGTYDSTFVAFSHDGTLLLAVNTGFRIHDIVRMGSSLVVSTDAGVLHSTDGGSSWTFAELQPPEESWGKITVFDATHAIIGAIRTSRTSDGGRTWREPATNHRFDIQRVASTSSSKCVSVTSAGEIVTSTDTGVIWTVKQRDVGRVSDLCVINDRVIIMSADTFAVARSSDEGESWQWIQLEQEDPIIALERLSDYIVVALTQRGLFTSFNAGMNWGEVHLPDSVKNMGFRDVSFAAEALLTQGVWKDAVFVSNDVVLVAGASGTLLQGRRHEPSAIIESQAAAPRDIILTCYPQPARASVTAIVRLYGDEEIKLRITDISGRVIAAYSPVLCSRGERRLTLPLHDARPGVYFLQLVSSKGVDTKPIVVLR